LTVRGLKIAKKKANHYFKLCGVANEKDFHCNYLYDMVHRQRNLCELAADIDHLKLLAKEKNSHGEVNYGVYLEFGISVAVSVNEAVKQYKRAADQGNCVGQFNYTSCVDPGNGVSKDLNEALKYFELLLASGDPIT
jgi:TPR repeat protein